MKETPLSSCERNSVISAIQKGLRHDNREFLEVRDINISFGKDFGSCTVTLGLTRVLAQVTCEVVEPRPSRPSEGKISISVHLSPMAAPHFEPGRGNDLVEELQQILDRNIKESRCLDLESLCILAEESVWQLRVDVTVLNHAGNLGDACNLASVAALRHFHRPDVTVEEDGRVTIHTLEEREPIPTFMKKVPVCLTYAFFMVDEKCHMLMDPSDLEERVMSGKLIVGLNPHGEITSMMFPGRVALQKREIMNCIQNAFLKAKASAEMVARVVDDDVMKRKSLVKPAGYTNCLVSDSSYRRKKIDELIENEIRGEFVVPEEPMEEGGPKIEDRMYDSEEEEEEEESTESSIPKKPVQAAVNKTKKETASMSDSEEEETGQTLTAKDLQ